MRASVIALFLVGCATAPPAKPPAAPRNPDLADELIAGTGTTTIDLFVDMGWYLSTKENRVKATIVFGSTKAAIEVDRIGDSSKVLCRYNKLRLRFGEAPKKRLYLNTHCNDVDPQASGVLQGEVQLYGQALAQRLLGVVGVPALATRMVMVRWIDTRDPTQITVRPAILVEDAADVARTIAGDEKAFQGPGKEGDIKSLDPFDPYEVARAHLFEMMINNRDWRAFRLKPLGRWFLDQEASPLHNFFAIIPKEGPPVLMPQDLDASTFAAIPQTVAEVTGGSDEVLLALLATREYLPNETSFFRWLVMRLQHFRRSHSPPVVARAVQSFVDEKEALYAEIDAFAVITPPAMKDELVKRSRAHLDAFFRAVEPPIWDLPVIAVEKSLLYSGSTGDATLCTDVPAGAPVTVERRENGRAFVRFGVRVAVDDGRPKHTICPGPGEVPLAGWVDERVIVRGTP